MNPALHRIDAHRRGISHLLILAFLLLTLFPAHYHLHHADEHSGAGTGAHVADLHGHGDAGADDHEDGAHTVALTTDIALKSSGVQMPLLALFLTLTILLPVTAREIRPRPEPVDRKPPRLHRYDTPPLRAPPRV